MLLPFSNPDYRFSNYLKTNMWSHAVAYVARKGRECVGLGGERETTVCCLSWTLGEHQGDLHKGQQIVLRNCSEEKRQKNDLPPLSSCFCLQTPSHQHLLSPLLKGNSLQYHPWNTHNTYTEYSPISCQKVWDLGLTLKGKLGEIFLLAQSFYQPQTKRSLKRQFSPKSPKVGKKSH